MKKFKRKRDLEGTAFIGFFFIGMAIGAAFSRWDVGPFLGLGMGFVAMLIVMMKAK